MVIGALYFAQGLPFGFFAIAVPVLLRRSGVSLALTGLSSLLATPWALKFLWAPLVDIYPRRGRFRRRLWIIGMQIAVALTLTALALSPLSKASLTPILIGFVCVSFLSATQDAATDALSLDLIPASARGLANAIQVGAYRLGMIAGGGGILYFFDALGFQNGFLLMAAMSIAFALPTLLVREKEVAKEPHDKTSWKRALSSFWSHARGLELVALLFVLKIGDALGASMMKPLLVDEGFSDREIAMMRGTAGGIAALVGAVIAVVWLREGRRRSAFVTAVSLQTVAIAAYIPLAMYHPGRQAFLVATIVEHVFGTIATAATFATMMDRCRPTHRATDYAIQSSIFVMTTGLGLALGGFLADRVGYPAHYSLAAVLGVAAPWAAMRLASFAPPPEDGGGERLSIN
jgi:MFS transporter, PAT family, beta-lactamase induction signal transducer AmpG